MEGVDISFSVGQHASAVFWIGGTVKIVNSNFVDSHGLLLSGTNAEFVNSAYHIVFPFGSYFNDNIILARGADLTARASTFYWGSEGCQNCTVISGSGNTATKGLGFVGQQSPGFGLPSVRFESTALGSVDAERAVAAPLGRSGGVQFRRQHLGATHHGPGCRRTGGDPAERLDRDAWADHAIFARAR